MFIFFGFGIAKLISNLIRNCRKGLKDTEKSWAKEREKIFREQENFCWLSWKNKDFLFSMGRYCLHFSLLYVNSVFSYTFLFYSSLSSLQLHEIPLWFTLISLDWIVLSMLQLSWEAISNAQPSCNIWFSSHEASS